MTGFRRPAVGFVLACVFLDALGIASSIPRAAAPVGTLAETRELQTVWYSAIMLSYGLMQFAAAPVISALRTESAAARCSWPGAGGLALMMVVPVFATSLGDPRVAPRGGRSELQHRRRPGLHRGRDARGRPHGRVRAHRRRLRGRVRAGAGLGQGSRQADPPSWSPRRFAW